MPYERLICHAGTPKTGTTSLQIALEARRAELLEAHILFPRTMSTSYPGADGRSAVKPKHQWIVDELIASDSTAFEHRMIGFFSEAPPQTRQIIISSEGLYNHWWDFSDAGRAALTALSDKGAVELWLWLRDPVDFFLSNYAQMLKNPRHHVDCYGRDWSPERMFEDVWFRRRLDYAGFLRSAGNVFGEDAIRVFHYRRRTVADGFEALGVAALAPAEPAEHRSPGAFAVEQLRALNRAGIAPEDKMAAVLRVQAEEQRLDPAANRFTIDPALRTRIIDHCAEGLDYIDRRFGIDLRPNGG